MSTTYATSAAGLVDLYNNATDNGWIYQKPRGQANQEYYRVADFCKIDNHGTMITQHYGYNHGAANPFGSGASVSPTSVVLNGSLTISQQRPISLDEYPDTDMTVKDINDTLENFYKMQYYGFVIKPANSTGLEKVFGNGEGAEISTTRGKEEFQYTLPRLWDSMFSYGEYTIYPCISNQPLSDNNESLVANQRLYAIPGASALTIMITLGNILINVTAKVKEDTITAQDYTVQWTFTAQNYNSSPVTLTNGKARFRFPEKAYNDPIIIGQEVEIDLGSLQDAAGTITVPGATEVTPGQITPGEYHHPTVLQQNYTELTNFDLDKLYIVYSHNTGSSTESIVGSREFIKPAQPELNQNEY